MKSLMEDAILHVLQVEGDFSDIPADRGGKTRYGITQAVARRFGYKENMKDLPKEIAIQIYRESYWSTKSLDLDIIGIWSEAVAMELFDTAVNMGVGTAAKFFQKALNFMNRNGSLYADLKVDGQVGESTLRAMRRLQKDQEKRVVYKLLDTLQGARYIDIMIRKPSQETFIRGWMDNRTR